VALGCRLDPGLDASTVCLAFGNYRLRRITIVPRRVHRSDTLLQRSDLSVEEREAIDAIERKAGAGLDLYPHQSTTLLDPLAKDGLLADWRIQHLHLGLPSGKPTVPPFVNRSKKVLLVRITETDAYFIDCVPHGKGADPPWWNTDLPETLHRNWPASIAPFKVDGYEPKLTWEDHRKLRPPKGFTFTTAVTTADGTSYLLSDGLLSNGYSVEARRFADRVQTKVVEIALRRTDNEKLVLKGDHREVHVYVEPR
jgi:hypothetical protein